MKFILGLQTILRKSWLPEILPHRVKMKGICLTFGASPWPQDDFLRVDSALIGIYTSRAVDWRTKHHVWTNKKFILSLQTILRKSWPPKILPHRVKMKGICLTFGASPGPPDDFFRADSGLIGFYTSRAVEWRTEHHVWTNIKFILSLQTILR